jgi:hypothetical protein
MSQLADFLLFATKHLQQQQGPRRAACTALKRVQNNYAYRAPECRSALWNDIYNDVIVPHIVPYDGEPWTTIIKQEWAQAMQSIGG